MRKISSRVISGRHKKATLNGPVWGMLTNSISSRLFLKLDTFETNKIKVFTCIDWIERVVDMHQALLVGGSWDSYRKYRPRRRGSVVD